MPQPEQLSKFVNIQKHCIIEALHCLIINNYFYENVDINYHLLKTWEDKIIFSDIIESMVHFDFNHHKCENYATELNNSNFENNFNAAIVNTGFKKDYINSGCEYSDINNRQQNSIL